HDLAADRRPGAAASGDERRTSGIWSAGDGAGGGPRDGVSGLHELRSSYGAGECDLRAGMSGNAASAAVRVGPRMDHQSGIECGEGPEQIPARAIGRHAAAGGDCPDADFTAADYSDG